MKERVEVWGHSDDLIEFQSSNGSLEEELAFPYDKGPIEYCAAGVVFCAEYDGEWSFDVWSTPDSAYFNKFEVGMGPSAAKNDYTQCLVIHTERTDPVAYRV